MNRQLIAVFITTFELMVGQTFSLSVQAEPSHKHNLPLRQDDVAFGGISLKQPLILDSEEIYVDVLSVKGVHFSPKNKPKPRAVAIGTLSLLNTPGTGNAIVKLRVTIDGNPEPTIFTTTVFDGFPTTAMSSIQCDEFPADGRDHTVTLQILVIGSGQVTVDTGSFELLAIGPIWVPS